MTDDSSLSLGPDDFARRLQEVNGDWIKLADDDRARRELAAHLASTGRHEELFALVAGSSAWAEARYAREGSYAGYLNDLDLAWDWCESEAGWSVGRQIRCALIKTSIQSLAGNLSPELLAQVVEAGLWSPEKALAHVRRMPDEFGRAQAIARLAPLLPDALKAEALEAAQTIVNDYARANVLGELMPHLPQSLKVKAFEAARSIGNEAVRAMTLAGLASLLPGELKAEALSQSWQTALSEVSQTPDASDEQITHLLDTITTEAIAETLDAAPTIGDEEAWGDALSNLARELPDLFHAAAAQAEAIKTEALAEALQAASAIDDESARADALIGLAPLLPEALKPEAVQTARALSDDHARAHALSGMAPYLPEALKAEALTGAWQAARAIPDGYWQAVMLSELAPHLPADFRAEALAQALKEARNVADVDSRARALCKVAPLLSDDLQAQTLAEAMQETQKMTSAHARADTLSQLASHLPNELKTQAVGDALRAALAIGDEEAQTRSLNALARHLPDDLKTEASRADRGEADEDSWIDDLNGLAPPLPKALETEASSVALQAARAISDEEWRAYTLSNLAPNLSEADKPTVLPEAFELAKHVASPAGAERRRASVLHRVATAWQAIGFAGLVEGRKAWRETLRELARHRRPELLYDLTALLPLIYHLGGTEAVREMRLAISDITKWWP